MGAEKSGMIFKGRQTKSSFHLSLMYCTKRGALLALALLVSASALFVWAAGCGSGGVSVSLRNLSFDPDTVTIKKGETVTWTNDDRRSRQIMSGNPPIMTDDFMSPVLQPGDTWSHTFNETGDFPYHDMKIPNQLGRVVVEE